MAPVPRRVDAAPARIDLLPEASDAEVLAAVADRRDGAFEELRRRYVRAVERACRATHRDAVEDCVQEAFVRIWQKARLFDARRGSAPAWILTVTRNVAHNLRAKAAPDAYELVDEDSSVVEDAAPAVDAVWLETGLAQLGEHERRVIELAYFSDLSQTQIAERLGVPLGTVKSWTRRGLNRLAELLADDEDAA